MACVFCAFIFSLHLVHQSVNRSIVSFICVCLLNGFGEGKEDVSSAYWKRCMLGVGVEGLQRREDTEEVIVQNLVGHLSLGIWDMRGWHQWLYMLNDWRGNCK